MAQRKQYSGEFKARVVLQALKGQHTLNEIASKYGVHLVQVAQPRKPLSGGGFRGSVCLALLAGEGVLGWHSLDRRGHTHGHSPPTYTTFENRKG